MRRHCLAGTLGSILTLVALVVLPSPVAASSISYIDHDEVWVSTLDGKSKARLSSGEGDWRGVAASDGGKLLGIRLESGKIFQLTKTQLWDKDGQVLSKGPLPSENIGWSSYVAPLGLDLSSDGDFLAYGYSGYTGIVPNANFYRGHYVINSDTKTLITPIGQGGYEWPTMFGRRVVAASGDVAFIQTPGTGPFGTSWTGLVDVSGSGLDLVRSDVSATGKVIALELESDSQPDRIGVVSISGVDPPVTVGATVDCFLPTVGDATEASLSQDGTRIAWRDDQGVKVAGVPTTLADPCTLTSPPVTISTTGRSPSIGGASFSSLNPPDPAPSGIKVVLPPKLKVKDLASPQGLGITVKVPRKGRVRVSGTVPASRLGLKGKRLLVVVKGSGVASKAGPIKVRLRIVPRYLKYKARLKGATVLLTIRQGSRSLTRKVKLR
ncbi:MAG: hypothetical protein JJE13_05645 [Thermoleophilia bacterium]|nr:hypothetical protein [Thermoleophilia bacterium]